MQTDQHTIHPEYASNASVDTCMCVSMHEFEHECENFLGYCEEGLLGKIEIAYVPALLHPSRINEHCIQM